jgi:hypothetical protein
MKRIFIICFLTFSSFLLFSQPNNYAVENIPIELRKNAGSVVRFDQMILTVKSISKIEMQVKYAITILHESHKSNAVFREVYDKFSNINSIKITIYDKNGKKVKKVSKSDILDLSSFSSSALFADIRQKYYEPEYFNYPYTIEWSFEETSKGVLSYPSFYCLGGYDESLEKGEFIINISDSLRFKKLNTDTKPQITKNEEGFEYKWKFENIRPIKNEDFDLNFYEIVPAIKIAPKNFEMEDYVGNAETWEGFGKWIYSLNYGRDELPQSVVNEIKLLTKDAQTKREKVKLVYEYMQSKTRYVNVSIGIGGWQPFTAEDVEKNGYGDCKALSNYTHSLLKTIDIESVYAIIRAGSAANEIIEDFPSNQFNHAILCVPDGNDSIWLECTSQRKPFNYFGSFTEGRNTLLIKENNSVLVKTPALTIDENLRKRKAYVIIDDQGNIKAEIENKYQGYYYDNKLGFYYLEGKRRMNRVRNSIYIENFSLNDADYSIEEQRSENPYLDEKYKITAAKYVKKLGSRLLFNINFFNTEINVPSSINKQKSDIRIYHSKTKIDSLEFIIPDGYLVKSFPENDTLISEFGEFSTEFILAGNSLKYIRKQLLFKGTYSSEKYSDLRSYLKEINLADNRKVLLMPKE